MSASSDWLQSIIPVEVPNTSLTSFSSYTLKNLDNETVYDVRVKAVNKFGMSTFSKVFNFYVKTAGLSNKHKCLKISPCTLIPAGSESDIAPRSLLTETKEVSSGSSTISLFFPVMFVILSVNRKPS